jgi:hypothetical protein
LAVCFLIWAAYGFRYSVFADAQRGRDNLLPGWEPMQQSPLTLTESAILLARDNQLLPEGYLYGLMFTRRMSKARESFMNGDYRMGGRRLFFPYAFLVKTPLALFFILGFAAAGGILICKRSTPGEQASSWGLVGRFAYRIAPLLVLFTVYWLVALGNNLNIGHRHLLPTYPPLFVLAGAAGVWLRDRQPSTASAQQPVVERFHPLAGTAVLLAVGWAALEAWGIRPHYLAYFNALAGGPSRAYHHLVDSSLDWGQDLPGLKKWLDERELQRKDLPVYLAYFGSVDPKYYGIQATPLPSFGERRTELRLEPLRPGVYCISATMLQGMYLHHSSGPDWTIAREEMYRSAPTTQEGWDKALAEAPESERT